MTVAGFIGATLGSLITGYLVESHRQRNRLQLAAIDKRLEAHQDGFRLVFEIAAHLETLQNLKEANSLEEDLPENEKLQQVQTRLETIRSDALE